MNELLNEKKADDKSLSFSDELARAVLNTLSAHIAILDRSGFILETNNAWQSYSARSGMPEDYDSGKSIILRSVMRPGTEMLRMPVKLPKAYGGS